MMDDGQISYLASILGNNIKNILIYRTDDNTVVLYDQYFVSKNDKVKVYRWRDDQTFTFSNLKNAVSWSILDWNNKIYAAKRVKELDMKLDSLFVEISIHKRLSKHRNLEIADINKDKLSSDVHKQRQFQHELDKYIILANSCQQRGFENELTRTARK